MVRTTALMAVPMADSTTPMPWAMADSTENRNCSTCSGQGPNVPTVRTREGDAAEPKATTAATHRLEHVPPHRGYGFHDSSGYRPQALMKDTQDAVAEDATHELAAS
jgi:hypothetical protein